MLERPPTDEHPPTASRPLIYCGLSSFAKADQQLIKAIIAAAADSPQWDWILGLGNSLQPEDLGLLPANLKAFAWAPQINILQRADCAIITAGINSINECISCGVPMLVYSLGHADQNGNAARIAYHRLGIVEDREQNDATRVCRHIQTLLTDRSYGAHVERMKTCFLAYEQEQRAVEIIEQLLRAQPVKKPLGAWGVPLNSRCPRHPSGLGKTSNKIDALNGSKNLLDIGSWP